MSENNHEITETSAVPLDLLVSWGDNRKGGLIFLAVLSISVFLVYSMFTDNMTREETIKAVAVCEDAGLTPRILINGLTDKPRDVVCLSKD